MKKLLLLLATGLFASSLFAQVEICDFETTLKYGPVTIGGSGLQTTSLVANPSPDAINSSATVLKVNANAIGTNGGNKIDAIMFQLPEGVTFKANDYSAVKVNIYVTGGTPATILKPRGKAGVWNSDNVSSPNPGTWIGVVKNRVDGEDGLATNKSGWMECYFDISSKTQTNDYDAFQIQVDWNDERAVDLEIYFDDFVLVNEIPTGIEDEIRQSSKVYYNNGIIKVLSDAQVSEIAIVDLTGKLVKKAKGNDVTQLSVAGLPTGIYIVKVVAGGIVMTEKVMKN
ncbi:MAG: T9SS type A sorting domain-containing protein [Bacteroidales bacterium]|nr:T9SS type A sorting domain-containing protein [Bacteroidales bacterium]